MIHDNRSKVSARFYHRFAILVKGINDNYDQQENGVNLYHL